jgi:hypothetical protein
VNEPAQFDLALEVHQIQRRPSFRQLLLNEDYRGLCVLDISTHKLVLNIPFPADYASDGGIDNWCLRADGDAAIVFRDDDDAACWFSLREQTSRSVSHPPWSTTQGMPYDWRGDALWLMDPESFRFAVLYGGETVFRETDGFQALQENRAWRRSVDRMRRAGGGCWRVEPEHARLLYVATNENGTQAGIIGWVDQIDLAVPVAVPPPRIAAHQRQLFLLHEYEAMQVDTTGAVVRRFPVPEGFRFVGLDTVPADGRAEASLVLVSTNLDGGEVTRFSVYPLAGQVGFS